MLIKGIEKSWNMEKMNYVKLNRIYFCYNFFLKHMRMRKIKMKKLFFLFFLFWSNFSFASNKVDYFHEAMNAHKRGNYLKAAELYKKACDMGNASGCNNLGILYKHGQGVRQSYLKAAELYKKTCDMGYAAGCYNLGGLY